MINDSDRRLLHDALLGALGDRPSEVLMELLPPAGWTDLATRTDIIATQADIELAKAELRSEMQQLRNEVHELRVRVDSLVPKMIAANIASMITMPAVSS